MSPSTWLSLYISILLCLPASHTPTDPLDVLVPCAVVLSTGRATVAPLAAHLCMARDGSNAQSSRKAFRILALCLWISGILLAHFMAAILVKVQESHQLAFNFVKEVVVSDYGGGDCKYRAWSVVSD